MAVFNIAAGHGKTDSGAVGANNRYESNDNLNMALAIGSELTKRGHIVRQFRTDNNTTCGWQACRNWLESNKADFSIVVHRNAYNGTAYGVEVWSFDADAKSTEIAKEMSAAISSASGMYNRGRKGNGAAWLSANVRCCQLETGFIDNASDNEKYDKSFNAIVNAVCNTLEKHYGKGTVTPDNVIAKGTTTNYLNIRKSAVNGAVLTSMPTGSVCDIYSIENGWGKLSWNGYEGYSSVDYMKIEYIKKEEPKKEEPKKEEPKKEVQNAPTPTEKGKEESFTKTESNLSPKEKTTTEGEIEASNEEAGNKELFGLFKLVVDLIKKFIDYFKNNKE